MIPDSKYAFATLDFNLMVQFVRLEALVQSLICQVQIISVEILIRRCDFIGDRRDQKILDRLRAERKEKIDELKERTNYYVTQQLIQVIVRCNDCQMAYWFSMYHLLSLLLTSQYIFGVAFLRLHLVHFMERIFQFNYMLL